MSMAQTNGRLSLAQKVRYYFNPASARAAGALTDNIITDRESYSELQSHLSSNSYSYLLHRVSNVRELRGQIEANLIGSKTQYSRKKLHAAFKLLDEFCTNEDGSQKLRKDGFTPEQAHSLSVALCAAQLGCRFETVLAAMFHDMIEDAEKTGFRGLAKGGRRLEVEKCILNIGGQRVRNHVVALSKGVNEEYADYLIRLFNYENVEIAIVKFLDTLDRLKNPAPFGMETQVERACDHMILWKKINMEIFGLIHGLAWYNVLGNEGDVKGGFEGLAEILKEIGEESLNQFQRDNMPYILAYGRHRFTLDLVQRLPDEGTLITVYNPEGRLAQVDFIEVEFPRYISAKMAGRLMKEHLDEFGFRKVPSVLPKELVCTTIFRAQLPKGREQNTAFRNGMLAIADMAGDMRSEYLKSGRIS